jgi:Flp pilus assembly protein CpaB
LNKRLRTGIIVVLAGIAVIFIGVFVIGNFVRQSLTPPPPPTAIPMITEKIVVASHDLALGTLLKASDLTLLDVPIGLTPRDVVTDIENAVGRITKAQVVSGEMMLGHNLADPTNISHDLAYILGKDLVVMAFPANDLMSQINLLQRGDVVDIFASVEVDTPKDQTGLTDTTTGQQQDTKKLFTFDALQRVGITAIIIDIIDQNATNVTSASANVTAGSTPVPTPTPEPSSVVTKAYLLALTPQDALVLKHLVDADGRFDIVLRDPTSTELFNLSPVMKEYLIDRYQLKVKQ